MRSDCWHFLGSKNTDGYGTLGGNTAHRLSWEAHRGPIPKGLRVLHRCDNPPCINPRHLYLGTASDNNHDMYRRGRRSIVMPARKLTEDQVRIIRKGFWTPAALGRLYGVTGSTVSKVRKGRTWKHLKV